MAGHPTKLVNWIIVGHGPIVLAVDAGSGLDFFLISFSR